MAKRLLMIAAALAALSTPVFADGDAARGEKTFKKNCFACHKVGEGARNLVGPVLNDLLGRMAGTAEGFKYSEALIAAGQKGVVWDEKTLRTYLRNPRDFVPSTKMTFVGLAKSEDIEDIIAYLRQFSPNYLPSE